MINLKARKEGYISKTLLFFFIYLCVQDTYTMENVNRQEQESA